MPSCFRLLLLASIQLCSPFLEAGLLLAVSLTDGVQLLVELVYGAGGLFEPVAEGHVCFLHRGLVEARLPGSAQCLLDAALLRLDESFHGGQLLLETAALPLQWLLLVATGFQLRGQLLLPADALAEV